MSGQSVIDRLQAAKHSISGQGLAKSVWKATTEEAIGPKRKHLDYLLMCTNEPNVSIPNLASLLIVRTQSGSWVVVFKSLITIHNLMNYGNERFYQYLASNNTTLSLDHFVDKSNPQGFDMSTFIRKYAKYMNEKAVSYRQMAYDFCKVKRGKTDGLLRTMPWDKLPTAMGVLQHQIDVLLEFDATANDLTNGVINACFMLLFKDLIRLFACYNDGVINLLEKYFDLNKKQCRDALDIYKKFLVRTDNTAEFLKVAEPWGKKQNMGIDKGDIPDLTKAPASLLEALEQHLASLEGKKGAVSRPGVIASALKAKGAVHMTEDEKRKIIEEESKELSKLKDQKLHQELQQVAGASAAPAPAPAPAAAMVAPPPTAQPGAAPAVGAGAFLAPTAGAASAQQTGAPSSGSQDLLGLEANPFQAKVDNVMAVQSMSTHNSLNNMAGFQAAPAPMAGPGFTGSNGFAAAFGTPQPAAPQAAARMPLANHSYMPQPSTRDVHTLQPLKVGGGLTKDPGDPFGEVLQPQNKPATSASGQPLVKGDLDSSLASLAGNLSVNAAQNKKGNHQWNPPTEKKLTGGNNFQGLPSTGASWAGAGANPMAPGMNPYMAAPSPVYQPAGFAPATAAVVPQPFYAGGPAPMGQPMVQPAMGVRMGGAPPVTAQAPFAGAQPMQPTAQRPAASADPFGAL